MTHVLTLEAECKARITERWHGFLTRRVEWLRTSERFGRTAEKVAENIVCDLLTEVLDWTRGDLNFQVGRSDILLTQRGIKRLLIETKAPGHLASRRSAEQALEQARRYAIEQYVKAVAVSDGGFFYVADLLGGAYKDRVLARLDAQAPSPELWYVSVHGIYREVPPRGSPLLTALEPAATASSGGTETVWGPTVTGKRVGQEVRPAECFAYVSDLTKPSSWKLPYLLASGELDSRRLPMAVAAVLRNYRGRAVKDIPEKTVPEVLFRLGRAAWKAGRFPDQLPNCPEVFRDLKDALLQLGLWEEVQMDEPPAWEDMDRTPGT